MENYPSKTEKVYKILRDDVIEKRLLSGQRLVERELIDRLGVSKTPVREALARLKRDGLVRGNLHQSVFVTRILRKDAVEIYNLREVLEGLAAKSAAEKIIPDKAKKLRSIVQLSEECIKENSLKKYARLDLEFHNLIGMIGQNERLCKMMQHLHYQTRILMTTSMALPGRGAKISLSEHKKVVEAIINHNLDLAEKMAKEHIKKTKKAVLDWFDRMPW